MKIIVRRDSEFPLFLLSSQSLKYLTLTGSFVGNLLLPPTSTWDLPALTTLHLKRVTLNRCNFIIGLCQSLKTLSLNSCKVDDYQEVFTITNSQLLDLTLKNVKWWVKSVHVETPQLKTLCIEKNTSELLISAPNLTYFLLNGGTYDDTIKFSAEGPRSLEKEDLCVDFPKGNNMNKKNARKISNLLQHLHNVKCLALSLEMVEILCASVQVISHQPSPFARLESLMIYPAQLDLKRAPKKIGMPTEVKNYFLDSSPNATFRMVSREEARTIENTKEAKRCLASLQGILEEVKADMDRQEAQVEHQLPFQEIDWHLHGLWGDFNNKNQAATARIIFGVHDIKKLLPNVLESERMEIQACYSSLCAEAETVVNKVMDDMKNQIDIKRSLFSGYFDEFSSMSHSSS